MIIFMGSSFTRGGWDLNPKHAGLFLSQIVQDVSGYATTNLAIPVFGSERYLSSFLYACKYYNPKLFFVETAEDRSGSYFYIQNTTAEEISNTSSTEINQFFHSHGINNKGRHDFRLQGRIDPNSNHVKRVLKTSRNLTNSEKMINYFNYVMIDNDSGPVKSYKTNNNYVSLETLSKLTNIPVLYYNYGTEVEFCEQFLKEFVPTDRYLNKFHNLPGSVIDYTNEKLNGNHLADDSHHNYNADLLFAQELIIPFIKNYCKKNNILLDTV